MFSAVTDLSPVRGGPGITLGLMESNVKVTSLNTSLKRMGHFDQNPSWVRFQTKAERGHDSVVC